MLSLAIQESVELKLQTELAGDRLSRSQWKLLEIFATTTVGNVTEVAAYLGVSTAAASKAVDRLVRLHLLERTVDTLDRRHVRLALSPEGKTLAHAFLQGLNLRLHELLGEAESRDLAEIRRVLDELTAKVLNAVGNPSGICLQCGLNAREECLVDEILRRDCLFHLLHRSDGVRSRTLPIEA
ncbi:MAG: winged helix DNA-binding protein [Bryobacterales bacterium]|nr:winged helix DNA-binding protein [Bryobacterales bacterium]